MSLPIVTVGHKFEGICHICGDRKVQGEMITGAPERQIEGKDICVSGSIGLGYCGHTCEAIGQSEVFYIDNMPVVRLGDPVTGNIEGRLIEGWDFATSD